jgi:uncharacterized SAM-binding protein YcdF (DUF218 family)
MGRWGVARALATAVVAAWLLPATAVIAYPLTLEAPAGRWDAVVVPGCAPAAADEAGPCLRARVGGGVALVRARVAPTLVVSGAATAPGVPISEAEAGLAVARASGVPAAALRAEPAARSTFDNARLTAAMLPQQRVVVVTDAAHALRCRLTFGPAYGPAPDDVAVVPVWRPWRETWAMAVREPVALGVYALRGRLGW